MADGIIDQLMNLFKGIEKDDATLTTIEGGQKVALFGPGNEDAFKIGDDFDTIIRSILDDEQGQKIYTHLVDSGGINQLEALWKMGGSPSLEYTDIAVLENEMLNKDHGAVATYRGRTYRPERKRLAEGYEVRDVGTTIINGGFERDSHSKFNSWIAELAHGIGYENPSVMKIGKKEYFKNGKKIGENFVEPTYDFISGLGSFPEPQSPQDSLASYYAYRKSLPSELRSGAHGVEGSIEHTTHSSIDSALFWWLDQNLGIPYPDKMDWGYEDNVWDIHRMFPEAFPEVMNTLKEAEALKKAVEKSIPSP